MSKNSTSSQIPVVKKESNLDFIAGVYEENHKKLERLAIRKGSRPEDAPDVVNTAFCKVIGYLQKYDERIEIHKPYSFLAKTVSRVVIDTYNKQQPAKFESIDGSETPFQLSDKGKSMAEVNRKMDNSEYLEKILRSFTADFSDREKVLFRYIADGLKAKDIAAILGEDHKETSLDCNRLLARLRARVRAELANRPQRHLAEGRNK